MKLYSIKRAWANNPKTRTSYFISTYSILGIPFLKVRRTNKRMFYLFGIPVYQEKLLKHTSSESAVHLLKASIDIHEMPKASGLLRTFQLAELELLKKIDRVCKKHNICYWLDFGTLLGAVRHQGFIPWDDDVDIAMMREDYERFTAILDKEFPDESYSINSLGFLQIHVKGTMLQVDIFIYDQASEEWFPEGEKENSFVQKLYNTAAKLKYHILLDQEQTECIENYSYEQIKQLITIDLLNNKEPISNGNIFRGIEVPVGSRFSMKKEWIFPLREIEYEGHNFPIPHYPEAILFQYYGDWESIPKNPSYHFNLNNLTLRSYLRLQDIIKKGL